MIITVKYFAWLKTKTGKSEEKVELAGDKASIDTLISFLKEQGEGYAEAFANPNVVRCAVNLDYVELYAEISDGDEVGFFPPVTGG